jgi:crotonobetainyl-CoA:carnitine CoA-transferase CaiB-like acyl-CoA transferase
MRHSHCPCGPANPERLEPRMAEETGKDSVVCPFRILDLTDYGCMIGGRILGDLGADVIKIEPPGGSISRIAPYYKDIPHPEKSLYWFAYNANKRGITLDLGKADGLAIFRKLVATSDAVLESGYPSRLKGLGMGYEDLITVKPDIIVSSISPFGQNGPKSHFKGGDLTGWASGGYLQICGDPDRAPNWISYPQAFLHAGAEAAAGTMAALFHRGNSGEGQQVDVSIQECAIACNFQTPEMWDLNKFEMARFSRSLQTRSGGVQQNQVWKCKDGFVLLVPSGGSEPFASSVANLVKWMAEEGMAADWLTEMDWADGYDSAKISQELVNRVEEFIRRFLQTKTKQELYEEGALRRRIMVGPMFTASDISDNAQLKSRDFWQAVYHPELSDTLTYTGPYAKLSEQPVRYRRRAPLIGEHNIEVYERELGLTRQEVILMRQAAVI